MCQCDILEKLVALFIHQIEKDVTSQLIFQLNDGILPIVKAESNWKQDSVGWKIENLDGFYLIDAWYRSPESGMWCYMGQMLIC